MNDSHDNVLLPEELGQNLDPVQQISDAVPVIGCGLSDSGFSVVGTSVKPNLSLIAVESLAPAVTASAPHGLPFSKRGVLVAGRLFPSNLRATVCAVKVPSQRDRRSMNRRPGQRGTVNAVGENYVGRYWADELGSTRRVRNAVIIGRLKEMTKTQAAKKLVEHIEQEGVNSPAHLARSQSLIATFGDAAELWRQRQLIGCGKASSKSSMGCELRKHVLPPLKDKLIEDVNNYPLIRDCIQIWREAEREDDEIGYSRNTIKDFFGHIRAIYNFYRDETAQTANQRLASGS